LALALVGAYLAVSSPFVQQTLVDETLGLFYGLIMVLGETGEESGNNASVLRRRFFFLFERLGRVRP